MAALTLAALPATVASAVAQAQAIDVHTHLLPPDHGTLLLWGLDALLTYHYLQAELFVILPLHGDPSAVCDLFLSCALLSCSFALLSSALLSSAAATAAAAAADAAAVAAAAAAACLSLLSSPLLSPLLSNALPCLSPSPSLQQDATQLDHAAAYPSADTFNGWPMAKRAELIFSELFLRQATLYSPHSLQPYSLYSPKALSLTIQRVAHGQARRAHL